MIADLILELVAITSTGALSPGPLTFAAVAGGSAEGWKNGFKMAWGHAAVELPLILMLAMGATAAVSSHGLLTAVSYTGGAALLLFGALNVRELIRIIAKGSSYEATAPRFIGGVISGAMFTGLNPYFIVWWASIGLKLLSDIVLYGGILLVLALYPLHISLDFAWLMLVSHLSKVGRRISDRMYALLLAIFTAALIYYGIRFLLFI